MTRTGIIAAMSGELKPLVRGWKHESRGEVQLWAHREEDIYVAACAGAGQPAATRAFAALEDNGTVDLVFSIGWAGALTSGVAPGGAYNVAGVIDALTGERFRCEAGSGNLWVVTSPRVADTTEKRRLASAYSAALVDMEASAVARLAAMRGIPFYCIKGVSDGLTDKLPDFNRFITEGQFKTARFAAYALIRPWYWPALARMGENSKKASQSIAESLRDFLNDEDKSG